jgi:hypothetical protein
MRNEDDRPRRSKMLFSKLHPRTMIKINTMIFKIYK